MDSHINIIAKLIDITTSYMLKKLVLLKNNQLYNKMIDFSLFFFFLSLFFPIRHVFLTPEAYLTGQYSDFTSFSLYLSDILLLFVFLIAIYQYFRLNKSIFQLFSNRFSLIALIIWLILGLIMHFSSISLYWTVKWLELIVAYGTVKLVISEKGIENRIGQSLAPIFVAFSAVQSIIALLQFYKQTSLGLYRLGESYLGPNITVEDATYYKLSVMVKSPFAYVTVSGGSFTADNGYGVLIPGISQYGNIYNTNWVEIRGTIFTSSTTLYITVSTRYYMLTDSYIASIVLVKGHYINRDYFVVGQHDKFIEVGNSKVFLKFSDENESNLTPGDKQETKFLPGDLIEITCKGLELEQDSTSVQVYRDQSSVNLYGVQENTKIDNRFLTVKEARDLPP
jgi:hypothetical protein